MKKALITGCNGFVGKHLSWLLKENGREVYGIDLEEKPGLDFVRYSKIDILDTENVSRLLKSITPDEIYHLAAITYLPEVDNDPCNALNTNIIGTLTVLDAMRKICPGSHFLFTGSSKEYDNTVSVNGIQESAAPNPTNFYGISKYTMELIAQQYVRQYGLDVRMTRSFNHTGPGQNALFVCSDWARQIVDIINSNKDPVIHVGDIGASIDFVDVRDVVRAYLLIMDKGAKGTVYNVCSGRAISLEEILEMLVSKTDKEIRIEKQTKRLRSHSTSPYLSGSSARLFSQTGWKPEIPVEQSLDDLLEFWKKQAG